MTPLLRVQVTLLAATASCAAVSVFAAQVGLALVATVHLARIIKRETRGFALPIDAAVGSFAIWTFMSAAFAPSPIAAHESAKKLVLFFLLYFAAEALRTEACREVLLDGMLIGGLALAAFALLQYQFLGFDTMDARPRSFLGHYMTASGVIAILLMIAVDRILNAPRPFKVDAASLSLCAFVIAMTVVVMLSHRLGVLPTEVERLAILAVAVISGRRAWRGLSWPGANFSNTIALVMAPVGALALLVSRTRSAWLGVLAGLAILAWTKRKRLLLFLPGLVALVLLLSPRLILDRVTIQDASTRDRYFMWQAGLDMVMDKPIFGQGTGMILEVYPRFRWEGAPNPNAPHLHNNFIQIAAERGLPCLVFLGWWLFLLAREAWRVRETSRSGVVVLAALTVTLTSGMFEYTLGDSEILMLILLLSALPFSIRGYSKEPLTDPASDSDRAIPSGGAVLVLEQ